MPDLAQYFYPAWLLLLSVSHVVTYLRKPGADAGAALATAQQAWANERAQLQRDIHALQVRLEHTPSREEMAELEGNVREVAERTRLMSENMTSLVGSVQRVETYLLQSKRP